MASRLRYGTLGVVAASLVSLFGVPADAHGKRCVETGDTVGETKCRTYGQRWAIENQSPFTARFGIRYAEFNTGGLRYRDNMKKKDRPKGYPGFSFPGEALGVPTLSGFGPDGGLTLYLVDQLYIGGEMGFLFGGSKTATMIAGQYQLRDAGRGIDTMLWHGGIPIGYRIPLGRAHIRAEVLGGGVLAMVMHDISGPAAPSGAASVAGRWIIEPRIAADIWFTQHMTFGGYAGMNVLDSGSAAFGLSLTFHNRAFDGDWALW